MKNTFKKISALVVVLVMVLTLSVVAFASDDQGDVIGDGIAGNNAGVWTTPDTPVTQGTTLTFHKEITAYNPETCTVNAPTITFNYTIAPGTAGKNITDDKTNHDPQVNVTVPTKAGVGSPVISSLALTPTDTLNASEFGTSNWFDITVNFASVNFLTAGTGAGVYRYVIEETTTEATKNASGIYEEDTPVKTLYLDVYVNGDGTIYGYVLFQVNDNIDATTSAAAAASAVHKVEGFISAADDNVYASTDTPVSDKYYTFNLELKKDVVNDAYISTTNHQFPFKVQFTNATVTAAVLPAVSVKTGTATIPTLSAGALSTFVIDGTSATAAQQLKLADEAIVLFKGIPAGTTVTIDEYNNVTGTLYTVTTTGATVNEADGIDLTWNAWATSHVNWADKTDDTGVVYATGGTALTRVAENFTTGTGTAPVVFVNTLLQISPTGVVMRVAPYAAILGAGVLLFAVSRRFTKKKDDEVAVAVEA